MTTPRHRSHSHRRVRRAARSRAARAVAASVATATLALTLALALAPAAAADTQTQFTLVGRGWGHGIGMCQYGAYGYAKRGYRYDAIIKHYYTGVRLGRVGNPTVRVMLNQGLSSAAVSSTSGYKAASGDRTVAVGGGVTATVTWSGSAYHLSAGAGDWYFDGPVTFTPGSARLKLHNQNQNGHVGRYRGSLRVIHLTGGLQVVNRVRLEAYLYGVVPRESPSSWPIEALKAQAVAARSFAIRSVGKPGSFDVYCTASSQVYNGFDGEAASTNTAVNRTAHVVPTYGGRAISAYYFSTSGGHTESIENAWGGEPVPYLKGVPDPYETSSPYHTWPENPIRRSPATIANQLGAYSSTHTWGVKGALRAIYVTRRGASPRIVSAVVVGSNGASLISGARIRAEMALRDSWVFFTSLSVTPSQSTHKTITYGKSTTVSGRRYPAIADGGTVTLHYHPTGGGWATRKVTTQRHSQAMMGRTVRWSEYSPSVEPSRTTEYYFSSGRGVSPHTTISVRYAATMQASTTSPAAGDTVVLTGAVKPSTDGKTVWLQAKGGGAWGDIASTTLKSDGTYRFEWTATAGTTALRLRVPKAEGLLEGVSDAVELTAPANG